MNSFMSWVGGKKALRDAIVTRLPSSCDRYVEVFGGGGWVLFHKTPGKFEVYNDFNPNLANLYRCVRDHPDELCEELRYSLNSRTDFEHIREVLKCLRDGRIQDVDNKKMQFLLMAVNRNFAYAEYDYGKYLMDKDDVMALEYFRQAAKHGCVQAEYAIGKRLVERGDTEEGLEYLERAASRDNWSKFYLGLLYCYRLHDCDKGIEHLRSASDQGFEPAQNAINNIQKGLNAKIITGICNLVYYASRIIDDRSESEYPHPAFDGVESRAKKEDRAKRMGITYTGM